MDAIFPETATSGKFLMSKRQGQMLTTTSRNTAFKENSSCVFDVKRSGGQLAGRDVKGFDVKRSG